MESYAFFDFETPNRRNDRPCSVGLERTDGDGNIEYSRYFLVDPEEGFDPLSMGVNGIRPSDVVDAPTFDELWRDELSDAVAGCVMVAHQASFDMTVLGKALDSYGIAKPDMEFIDTRSAAKGLLALPSYGLADVSAHYGVALAHHHNAMDDADACRGIYWAMRAEFGPMVDAPRYWTWKAYDPDASAADCACRGEAGCDAALTDLYGIALGLIADRHLLPAERNGLDSWMERNACRRGSPLVDEAYALLENILLDGMVTKGEVEKILHLTRPFASNGHNAAETVAMQELIGYLRGISCDRSLNASELKALRRWVESTPTSGNATFALVREKVEGVLEDGVVTSCEETELLELFETIVDPLAACGCGTGGGASAGGSGDTEGACRGGTADGGPTGVGAVGKGVGAGVDAGGVGAGAASGIVFEGRRFVLTGEFSHGSKPEVGSYIEERGGEVSENVSGKVSYVVMGSLGSDAYAYGKYGKKVEKAMELQDAGKAIQIITEEQLYA